MIRLLRELGRFLRELKRRNVYRVAVTYVTVAFVSLQAVNLLIPDTTLPDWAGQFLLALLIVGFPISVVLAWAFELTPEGVRRTSDTEGAGGEGAEVGPAEGFRPSDLRSLAGFAVVLAVIAGGWYWLERDSELEITDRSLAVLPFASLGESETTPFTDGIHAGILTRLSTLSDLNVKSRTSVMQYRDFNASLPQVASELGAAWIVRGEVQETEDRVRVTARLVDARGDRNVWADSYERELDADSLFAIEEHITREIAEALQVTLGPDESRRIERHPTSDLDAYRLYVRGRSRLDQRTRTGMAQAADLFRQAIRQDSSYALAWVGLADALTLMVSYGYARPDSVGPEGRRALDRALDLDPNSAEAHVSRALLLAVDGDGPGVIQNLRRAIEIRANYAEAYNLLGWYQPLVGRPWAGLEGARRAVDLDPLSPEAWTNLALGHMNVGQPDSALAPARRARELQPDYSTGPFYEAIALFELGRLDEADRILRDMEITWAVDAPRTTRALIRAARGDTLAARETLESLAPEGHSQVYRGLIHAALGEHDAALRAFEDAEGWAESPLMAWPNLALRYHYTDVLDPLRDDERYRAVIAGIDRAWSVGPSGG